MGTESVNENGGDVSKRSLKRVASFIRSAAAEEKLGDSWLGTLLIATSGRVISGIELLRTYSAVLSISIGAVCARSRMLSGI